MPGVGQDGTGKFALQIRALASPRRRQRSTTQGHSASEALLQTNARCHPQQKFAQSSSMSQPFDAHPSTSACQLTPLGEVDGLLLGLDGLGVLLLLGETATDGASLLVTEVEGHVLRLLVELAEVLALLLVDDSEDTGDRLADSVAVMLAHWNVF